MTHANHSASKTSPDRAEEFIAFIKDHPDIFARHPELLDLLSFSDDRNASSMLERQIRGLKERLGSFQDQQSDLIQLARENEQISDSFSDIICQLIGFNNLSEFAVEFPAALKRIFDIEEVAFKTEHSVNQRPSEKQEYKEALRRLSNKQAVCDNRWPSAISSLFFSNAMASAALIPLSSNNSDRPLGILALGSTDPERYTNELGTAHLNRLGLMAGICLSRLMPN